MIRSDVVVVVLIVQFCCAIFLATMFLLMELYNYCSQNEEHVIHLLIALTIILVQNLIEDCYCPCPVIPEDLEETRLEEMGWLVYIFFRLHFDSRLTC